MAATVYETSNEKAISGALALVMHSLFFAMLIFSVNWKKPEPAAMVAELWSSLPPMAKPRVEPPPPPPKVEPEPPKPAPKVEPKPVPKAEPKPQPKADIDLREKQEKERKAKEQAALEKKRREEQALAEKKKREEQKRLEEQKQRQAAEAEAKRLAQEQAEAQKKLAAAAAAAQAREIDKYKAAVAARIKRFIVEPPSLQGNPEVEFEVVQLPGGEILGVKTRKASGQTVWDNAVERAILRAQPLPQPPDPALFKDVRELHLKFRPKD